MVAEVLARRPLRSPRARPGRILPRRLFGGYVHSHILVLACQRQHQHPSLLTLPEYLGSPRRLLITAPLLSCECSGGAGECEHFFELDSHAGPRRLLHGARQSEPVQRQLRQPRSGVPAEDTLRLGPDHTLVRGTATPCHRLVVAVVVLLVKFTTGPW